MSEDFKLSDYLVLDELTEAQIDHCEFWVLANRKVRLSGKFNFCGERIQVNSKYNFPYIEEKLKNYHDKDVIEFFKFGWPLSANETSHQDRVAFNQKGAVANPEQVRKYIQNGLDSGALIGPFKRNPFGRDARFSPIDAIPKRDSEDMRIIINLSHPFSKGSVNASIQKDKYLGKPIKVKYPSVDDLVKLVIKKGRACLIFKRDLWSAYKQMWICPGDVHLLGYRFENLFYFEVTLIMGSRSSCYCCQRTTDAISYIYSLSGFEDVNYLDDLGSAEVAELANEAFLELGSVLNNFGIRESEKKATPPDTKVSFLGVLFDTEHMTLFITDDRRAELMELINLWLAKDSATLRQIQSLLGKLNFVCNTVRAGRVFVSRVINELKSFPDDNSPKVLSEEFKKDLNWWRIFMNKFDGRTMITDLKFKAPDLIFESDACLTGCGGWCHNGEYFHTTFPEFIRNNKEVSINELETLSLIICIKLWHPVLANSNLLIYCDNLDTVSIVNTGRAKNAFAQACLREICFLTANINCVVKVVHKPGVLNRRGDWLSRWDSDPLAKGKFLADTENIRTRERFVYKGLFEFSHNW